MIFLDAIRKRVDEGKASHCMYKVRKMTTFIPHELKYSPTLLLCGDQLKLLNV